MAAAGGEAERGAVLEGTGNSRPAEALDWAGEGLEADWGGADLVEGGLEGVEAGLEEGGLEGVGASTPGEGMVVDTVAGWDWGLHHHSRHHQITPKFLQLWEKQQ